MATPLRTPPEPERAPSRPLTAEEGEEFRARVVDAVNDGLIQAGILERQDSHTAQHEAAAIRDALTPIRRVITAFEFKEDDAG